MSLFFRAARTMLNRGGPRVGCIIAGSRGGANDSPASGSASTDRLRGRALAFAMLAAASGCTLTTDPFDPSVVGPTDGDDTSVESALPGVPVAPGDKDPSGEPNPIGTEEETDPNVSLDPNGTGGEQLGGVQNGTGSEGDGTDAGTAHADAGSPAGDAGVSVPPVVACDGLEYAGSCYEFFGAAVSWDEAEASCLASDGHLASIESAEEDAFLGIWPTELGVIPLNGSGIWLGGTDAAAINNEFAWSDASPFDFTAWGQNQPDNGAGVDCIEKRNDATARWYDQRCTDLRPYVCERPL
jgi:hypothetical protein